MTDLATLRAKVAELEENNLKDYQQLQAETEGRFAMDTSDRRRESFYEFLVELGIITPEQFAEFEIKFHTEVHEALEGAFAQLRAAKAEAKKKKLTVVKDRPKKLLGLDGKPL